MAVPEIIEKLQKFLIKGFRSEADIVYLLTSIRKIIEQENLYDEYSYLNFHCNWALHSRLDRGFARHILDRFNQAHIRLKTGIQLEDLPRDIDKDIDEISGMKKFRVQILRFLESHNVPIDELRSHSDWARFIYLYSEVIKDCPLVITGDETSELAQITVKFIPSENLKAGVFSYKISWILQDRNGLDGEIFVINDFQLDLGVTGKILDQN